MSLQLCAVILTFNEERNLPACLESLKGLCSRILLVDSGSTDRTLSIGREHGAEILQHPFETHSKQWNWALANIPAGCDWILALDADHRITPELKAELLSTLPETPGDIAGYYLPRKLIFRGTWLRFGGLWPRYFLKLFRPGGAFCNEADLVDHRFYAKGKSLRLRHPLIDENWGRQPMRLWKEKHLRYIKLQAEEEFGFRRGRHAWAVQPSPDGTPDQRLLWKLRFWYGLPLFIRPPLHFIYRYVVQLGFLDGVAGAVFHFHHGLWFRWMIDRRIGELSRGSSA
jgi:glycosyltransferase involved in cell wall biosynthesis